MRLKYITFTLENCDQITIEGKYVGDFYVGDIISEIKRIACNSIMKMNITKEFAIEIHKNANKTHYVLGLEKCKYTVFEILTSHNNITSIEFELEEQYIKDEKIPKFEHYKYFVNWTGDSDFVNDSQKSYISKPGHLYLVIDKKSNIEDYFDSEEIDNEEIMDFQFKMYDVGDEDECDNSIASIDSTTLKQEDILTKNFCDKIVDLNNPNLMDLQNPFKRNNFENETCKDCSSNPKNGGTGICFCTLGLPEIKC